VNHGSGGGLVGAFRESKGRWRGKKIYKAS